MMTFGAKQPKSGNSDEPVKKLCRYCQNYATHRFGEVFEEGIEVPIFICLDCYEERRTPDVLEERLAQRMADPALKRQDGEPRSEYIKRMSDECKRLAGKVGHES